MTNSTARVNPHIEDYAIIGNCRSAALVCREGSIDWLCWPRFDSPAIFCSLIDATRGGAFGVKPRGAFRTTRGYVGDTAVLRTTFHTERGEFVLTDAMPIASPEDTHNLLIPEHEIVRVLHCTRGEGAVEVQFSRVPDSRNGTTNSLIVVCWVFASTPVKVCSLCARMCRW